MLQLTVSRANNLILALMALLVAVLCYVEYLDYRKYRADLELKTRYEIGNTLIEAALDLSFERSLTQVANSLATPFPEPFKGMLMAERQSADTRMNDVLIRVKAIPGLQDTFTAPLERHLATIAALREEANLAIQQNQEQRDAQFVQRWPIEMPQAVAEIVNLRRALLTAEGQMPTLTTKLDTLALEAWRIREQAGRARTIFAKALVNGKMLSDEDLAFYTLRMNDAQISIETVDFIANSGGIPEATQRALATYKTEFLGSYKKLHDSLLTAHQAGQAYPISFDDYFKQSSAGLEIVETLSSAAREDGLQVYHILMQTNFKKFMTIMMILGITVIFAVWIGYYLKMNVTPRLMRMVSEVDKLANNDFTAAPDALNGKDEVGSVAKALIELKRQAEARVEADKKQLEMAREAERKAQHILTTTAEIADAASSTAAVIEGVASATAEMNSAIGSLAESARAISGLTQNASQQANQSVQANAILAESTKKISEMVGMIQAIAEQTNLLALNAAIEAARAGESGRGFAVVADEVKKLASLAEARSNEIQGQIREIAQSSEATIHTTDGLVKAFGEIDRMIQAMSSSMNEQQKVTNEITQNIQTAATSTQQVSVSIEALRRG